MKKFFAILFAVSALMAVSCNKTTTPSQDQKEDTKPQVDLTELNALIAECEALANAATTETFTQKSIDDFKSVINTVKQAAPLATSESVVNNLIQQLNQAKIAFKDSEQGAIPTAALAWALDFEEGQGTSLTTTGQYQWEAKLVAGSEGVPTFVDGHKAGSKGMQFGNGAHLEIEHPVASVLENAAFSIACWVNTPINENNYILSWNKWDTWKFQTQSTNKAFLTVCAASTPNNTYIDHDGNNEIPENEWHHVVATMNMTTGTMVFYLDGEQTILWNNENESKLTSNMAFNPAPAETILYVGMQEADADAYYVGKLDNLRFYTIALDAGQVSKLFADETK